MKKQSEQLLIKNKHTAEIVRFIIVGLLAAIIDFIFSFLTSFIMQKAGVPASSPWCIIVGTAVGFIISVLFNYFLSIKWVYQDFDETDLKNNPKKHATIFIGLSAIGLLVGVGIMAVFKTAYLNGLNFNIDSWMNVDIPADFTLFKKLSYWLSAVLANPAFWLFVSAFVIKTLIILFYNYISRKKILFKGEKSKKDNLKVTISKKVETLTKQFKEDQSTRIKYYALSISFVLFTMLFLVLGYLTPLSMFHVGLIAFIIPYVVSFIVLYRFIKNKERTYFLVGNIIVCLIDAVCISAFFFTFNNFLPVWALYLISLPLITILLLLTTYDFRKTVIAKNADCFNKKWKNFFVINWRFFVACSLALVCMVISFGACMVYSINSDFSVMTLEANDIISGNPFCNGWIQSSTNYVTTDLLPYELFVSMLGVSKYVPVLATWLMFVLVFLLGLILIKLNKNYHYLHVIIYIIGLTLLSPFNYQIFRVHTMVTIYAIIILILLNNLLVSNFSWRKILLVTWLTILVMMGDITFLPFFAVGIVVYYCLSLILKRNNKTVNIIALVAIIVGVIGGIFFEKLFYIVGGAQFDPGSVNLFTFVEPQWWGGRFIDAMKGFIVALGGNLDASGSIFVIKNIIAILLLVLIFVAVIYNIVTIFKKTKESRLIPFTLSFSIIVALILFTVTQVFFEQLCVRYIQSFVVFGLICIIYSSSELLLKAKSINTKRVAFASLFIIEICALALNIPSHSNLFVYPTNENDILIEKINENNLTTGFAHFWIANEVTVKSNDKIHLRPIINDNNKYRRRYYFENNEWYLSDDVFNFVVTKDDFASYPNENLTYESAVTIFGEPNKKEQFTNAKGEIYSLLIYDYDISTKVEGCLHYIEATNEGKI